MLASSNQAGTGSGNARSGDFGTQRISADGRYVLFYSEAGDLVPPGTTRAADIFVRDTQTGTTELVSARAIDNGSGGVSRFGLISDSGRYVAFTSFANNMVTNDTNSSHDVFRRDLHTNTTQLVSINAAGTGSGALGGSDILAMTPDGRFLVFSSQAQDLTAQPDENGTGRDIYVRDILNNVTALVSVNLAGTATGNGSSFEASISADGRYITFTSDASNLVANDTSTRDVFLRDLQAGTTIRISTNAAGTAGGNGQSSGALIDSRGQFVVFVTRATDLSTLPDMNSLSDIFLYNLQTGTLRLVTTNVARTASGSGSAFPENVPTFAISRDARFVTFTSQSVELVSNDTNGNENDVFLYDVTTQTNSLVSVNLVGNTGTSGSSFNGSFNPTISADGRFVAFNSLANNLVTTADEPSGFTHDVFVRDMVVGKTYLASINHAGTRTGNGMSFEPIMSVSGSRLVFFSRASDLVANDGNGFSEDVFYFQVPGSASPVLLTKESSQSAVAFDSVTLVSDPFPLMNFFNFSPDRRTRVSLFVWRLPTEPGDDASSIFVQAQDAQGNLYSLEAESVALLATPSEVSQVNVRLPESAAPGVMWLKVSRHGASTNQAFVVIKP